MNRPRRGFTLLELLVVIAVMAIIMAVLLPAMGSCRRAARNLKCMSQLRAVAYEFRVFADDFAVRSRGQSAAFGVNRFSVEDFQEKVYGVDEFWDAPSGVTAPYSPADVLLMCPAGAQELRRTSATPCTGGAVWPRANVSMGFNMRLLRAARLVRGRPVLVPVVLTSRVLDFPDVPLALDVDGAAADAVRQMPYFTAPPVDPADRYAAGEFWFPSTRHDLKVNVGFVGGHVASSPQPITEPGWRWGWQPD
jgi:prepilin-type N-terminal cleavage/methylation domain-containing protein/prepilin-type processing-associated H-X9-DG protein